MGLGFVWSWNENTCVDFLKKVVEHSVVPFEVVFVFLGILVSKEKTSILALSS